MDVMVKVGIDVKVKVEKVDNILIKFQGMVNVVFQNQVFQGEQDNLLNVVCFIMFMVMFIEIVGKNMEESL